jgi:HAD superfamily hydrolase (TIGR01509 family)
LPAYQAILFDFDGVLVDSEPVHFACWRETLMPFGIHLDWDTYRRRCIGITDRAMLEELCHLASPPLDIEELWREYPRKRIRFRQRMLRGEPISGDVKALMELLQEYRLAVVSSSGRAEVEPILAAGGIRGRFGAVVCREDVARHKPAPDPYRRAAELLCVTSALVVEDSEAGIASGRAAGFDVLAVPAAPQMPALLRNHLFGPHAAV